MEILSGARSGERVRLEGESYVIGSDEAAQITCPDAEVEWSHARIYRDRERYWLEDLQSQGGVFVNDKRTLHRALAPGDTIAIGSTRMRFDQQNGNGNRKGAPNEDSAPSSSVADFVAQVVRDVAPRAAPPVEREPELEPETRPGPQATAIIPVAPPPEAPPEAPEPPPPAAPAESLEDVMRAMSPVRAPGTPAPTAEELPDEEALVRYIERLREENADLRARCGSLETQLQRKCDGLSLATESFVEQLERAKERIAGFAKRHGETEALVRQREDELAKVREAHQELEARSGAQARDLVDKLESTRRDFDELSKIAAVKGAQVARLAADAKAAAPRAAGGTGPVAGATTALATTETGESRRTPTSGAIRAVTQSGVHRAAELVVAEPEPPPPLALPTRGLFDRILRSEWSSRVAACLIIAGVSYALVFLIKKTREQRPQPPAVLESHRPPPLPAKQQQPSKAAAPQPQKAAAPAPPKTPPQQSAATHAAAPPVQVAAAPAAGEGEDDALLAALRAAHRSRDEKKISAEEKALVAKGKGILTPLNDAYQKERQFNIKVSLQYVISSIEGKDSARDMVDAMRATKDPGEKMRLAFMLQKLNRAEDLPYLEESVANEQDPMIKKYLVRALGNMEGTKGIDVLKPIAQGNPDRNLRIEAIRAIEEKATPESASFLMDLSNNEQDASIKSIAVRALANTGGREAATYFQKVLEADERTNNRAEAAKYYARVGDQSDLGQLDQLYQRERVYYIKQKIRQAIDQIRSRNNMEPLPATDAPAAEAAAPPPDQPQ